MSTPAAEFKRISFDEAARLDPELQAGEVEAGKWVPITRNTWRHGQIVSKVNFLLFEYHRDHPGFSLSAGDPGTKLGRDPDTLRGPDIAMVRKEREPVGKGAEGWLDGAPDLAVEVIGDSQSHADLAKKALEYLAAGARLVWVVDADAAKVIVYTQPNQIRVLASDEILDGGETLPGFHCRVGELFE